MEVGLVLGGLLATVCLYIHYIVSSLILITKPKLS